MFDNGDYAQIYRHHYLLSEIERQVCDLSDRKTATLVRLHCAFYLPKTLVLSFRPLHPEYRLSSDEHSLEELERIGGATTDSALGCEGTPCHTETPAGHYFIEKFVPVLAEALSILQFSPILLIDVRRDPVVDKSVLIDTVNHLQHSVREVLLFASPEVEADMLGGTGATASGMLLVTSFEALEEHLEQAERGCNGARLTLPAVCTLASLDSSINMTDLERSVKECCSISLDISAVRHTSFFAAAQVIVLMHSISSRFGVVWDIDAPDPDALTSWSKFRFPYVVRPILSRSAIAQLKDRISGFPVQSTNTLGPYLFDSSSYERVIQAAEEFVLGLVGSGSGGFLNEYLVVSHEPSHTSYKSSTYRLQRAILIRGMIRELAENVAIHSDGQGYLAIAVRKDTLMVFIGDSGKGALRGILENYDLGEIVKDERTAIECLFKLSSLGSKRKKKHAFEDGAGYGLRDTVRWIFSCRGKFICRTGSEIASFMNPVTKVAAASLQASELSIPGIQYVIAIPLSARAVDELPRGFSEFMSISLA